MNILLTCWLYAVGATKLVVVIVAAEAVAKTIVVVEGLLLAGTAEPIVAVAVVPIAVAKLL